MTWDNWESDVALVENTLLYFVVAITLVSLLIVFACTWCKFFRCKTITITITVVSLVTVFACT